MLLYNNNKNKNKKGKEIKSEKKVQNIFIAENQSIRGEEKNFSQPMVKNIQYFEIQLQLIKYAHQGCLLSF